ARGQRRLPGRAPGPEGPEADRIEAADTPRGGRDRDVVTIRKSESCLPRGYVEGPQTWASMAAPWPLNSAKSCVPDSPEAWTCLDELNRSDSETLRHIRGWVIPSWHSERRSASGPSS